MNPLYHIKSFFRPQNIIQKKYVEEILRETLDKKYMKEIKSFETIEEYNVKNMIYSMIIYRNNKLEYITIEPNIDEELKNLIIKLYIENPDCKTIYCLEKTLEKIENNELAETFINNPTATLYHYLKLQSGYGPLYPLILDPYIEEISCSVDDNHVKIIHRKYTWYGWMNTNIVLDGETVNRLVLALARKAGKHLSLSYPLAEGLTPEGLRVSLTYGREVSRKGSSFIIRKKPPRIKTITELVEEKTIDPYIAAYLWLILELKGFILIGGGMGSGKTTLLQALLTLIPSTRRIVSIEDTPELMGSTGYWDPLVTRPSIYRDKSDIDMYKLLKFSLRRRADYIVVGEVRGREARLLVQASRLGHGILATIHGESPKDIIERLTAPPISIPKNLLSNIWSIVIMELEGNNRTVSRVYEIDRKLGIIEIYSRNIGRDRILNALIEKTHRLKEILDEEVILSEISNRSLFIQKLVNKGIFSIDALGDEILKYYYSELPMEKEARVPE